ncbi:hypothetical protein D7B24_000754 [Verticillium nonalfalfae]|uniref:Uncharacterized protein n=1 Tax=Verticillium nonalfalfae TaxID=1051616 RepID=A0A3M9Y4Y0_9PEZI|nr:uncharacterized protein D7B24_000754 [Verticillium nonalfalfae]RNJ54230.1 hypothetical protein D7B24_000754 [Verticillium nonalfalfae]
MSSPNLPDGAFLTSINGRRCTAIPKQGRQEQTTREAPTTTAQQPTPTPPARETPTPANPPPQQQNPPQDDTPARASSSPQPDPPQRDPPQAEPPRQTQADPPPPQESREPTSTSSTTTASPSPVITPSAPPQPIRTVITPPPASQIQNPLVPPTPQRPPPLAEDGRGPILVPSLTPPSPIRPPPLADEQPRPGLPSLSPSSPAPGRETGAQSSTTASDTTETSVLVPSPPAAPVLTPPTSPLAPVFPSTSDTQPSAVESSRTDQETAPTQANPGNVDGPQSDVEAPLGGASSTDDAASLITSAPVPIGGGGSRAGEDAVTTTGRESPLLTSPLPGSSADGGSSGMSAAIIAGAVVGGVAFLTICALLFWFWRKNKKKRRSTLLTPLSTQPPSMRKERPYIFDQESVGPTPRSTKFKAALGYSLMRLRGQVGGVFSFGHRRSSSAVLSKEQSQLAYSDLSGHSRHGSNASSRGAPAAVVVTSQDRARDWWDRLKMDALFNWRTRNNGPMDPDPFASVREKQSETVNNNVGQPDFLTLLGMDEREVEREAQRRRASRKHGSTASMDHFLSGLGLNVDKNPDPFSDSHALPAEPTRAAPTNPFDDSNAVAAPGFAANAGQNYIEALRRSRGTSMGGLTTRPPSTQVARSSRYDSVYRESGGSVDSFTARRNKWRSDPFDLERPDLLSSQGSSVVGGRVSGALRRPSAAHMRSESMQSKYSSGVGSTGWSEPGPDVGPTGPSGRWDTDSPTSGYRPGEQRRRLSGGSQQTQGSVGKAM